MDLRKLKTLIDLVSDSNISELEITEAEGKVRIVKGGVAPLAAPLAPAVGSAAAASAAAASEELAPAPVAAPSTDRIITSPMVGTFYRASSPGASPLADVGDDIKEGQPVCIIEAMKIMNEIESDCAGKVLRVMCENGQAVEFGQPLFVVG
ncbi:MAG: acetyl-CoA carboxylase biotin carboxyl carrier protein [Rubrivivax sp.]